MRREGLKHIYRQGSEGSEGSETLTPLSHPVKIACCPLDTAAFHRKAVKTRGLGVKKAVF